MVKNEKLAFNQSDIVKEDLVDAYDIKRVESISLKSEPDSDRAGISKSPAPAGELLEDELIEMPQKVEKPSCSTFTETKLDTETGEKMETSSCEDSKVTTNMESLDEYILSFANFQDPSASTNVQSSSGAAQVYRKKVDWTEPEKECTNALAFICSVEAQNANQVYTKTAELFVCS